jgi:hypothetical protein
MMPAMGSGASIRGGGRGRHAVARLAVSATCAVAVVAVGARLGPAGRPALFDVVPRAADLNLAEVRLDLSSLPAALESIRAAAPPGAVEIDEASLRDNTDYHAWWVRPKAALPPVRIRNVRLGGVLAVVFRQFHMQSNGLGVRQEPGRIVIGGPETARTPIVRRVYDVHDLAGGDSPPQTLAVTPATPAAASATLFGPAAVEFGDVVAGLVVAHGDMNYHDPASGWRATGFGGRVVIEATADGHRAAEQFLWLLRRGDSADVRWRLAGSTASTGGRP